MRKPGGRTLIKSILLCFCLTISLAPSLHASTTCKRALVYYKGSLVSREDTSMRSFLAEVLLKYREGFRGKDESGTNENLKHVRRMVNLVRENSSELKEHGIDPALLEVGIFLSDVAKNPKLIEKYKSQYGDNAFAAFLDHARLGLIEGLELKSKHKISDEQWQIIQEVIIGHDGPSTIGTWWQINFKAVVGNDYPELTPGSKYAFIHAILDRIDQGGLYRDVRKTYQGGVRKISFDQLNIRLKTPTPNILGETIEYALTQIYPGSRLQVSDLLNKQGTFFKNGIPLFLFKQIELFDMSYNVRRKVKIIEDEIHFQDKNGNFIVISKVDENSYEVTGMNKVLTVKEALTFFWNNL